MGKFTLKRTQKEAEDLLHSKWPNIQFGTYTACNDKYLFTCTDCGHQWTTSYNAVLRSARGCPKCGVKKAYLERAKQGFLSKVDQNKFEVLEFINHRHVKVKCKVCGHIRETTANNILRFGCKSCKTKINTDKTRKSTEQFIEQARVIHGDKYDYSKVNYVQNKQPVEIICPTHGSFFQTPSKHINVKQGCPKCAGRNPTKEEFLSRAKEIHGNFYDYSQVDFINMKTPINIICPKHGLFSILPTRHITQKCGCKKCHESQGEKLVNSILEELQISFIREVSILNPYNNDHNFRVDFYVEYKNQDYIIEYNGAQHYKPNKRMGGVLALKIRQQRDADLRKYCSENNIKLLEIKYDEKNVKEKIYHFLNVPSNQVTDQIITEQKR